MKCWLYQFSVLKTICILKHFNFEKFISKLCIFELCIKEIIGELNGDVEEITQKEKKKQNSKQITGYVKKRDLKAADFKFMKTTQK